MKKFLLKTALFSSAIFFVVLTLPFIELTENTDSPYLDAYNLLEFEALSPDVVFVGSSTLAFGLDEQTLINDEINFFSIGIHVGVGPKYSVDLLKQASFTSASTLIISPLGSWLSNPEDAPELPNVIAHSGQATSSIFHRYGLKVTLLAKVRSFVDRWKTDKIFAPYDNSKQGFGWSSQIFSKRGVIKIENKRTTKYSNRIQEHYTERIDVNLSFWMNQKERFTHILPVPIRKSESVQNQPYNAALEALSQLNNWPILLSKEQVEFPDSMFGDKAHLNREGSLIYSQRVSNAIKKLN